MSDEYASLALLGLLANRYDSTPGPSGVPNTFTFITLPLTNGARDYTSLFPGDGFDSPAYCKVGGFLLLRGVIDTQNSSNLNVALLPLAFRPAKTRRVIGSHGNGVTTVDVQSNGILKAAAGTTNFVSFDSVVYL